MSERPAVCRRADVDLAKQVAEILRTRGITAFATRAAEGECATRGRWKAYVIEYTSPLWLMRRPTRRWTDVRLIVNIGVITIGVFGCHDGNAGLELHRGIEFCCTQDPTKAADGVQAILAQPCEHCLPSASIDNTAAMCSLCREELLRKVKL